MFECESVAPLGEPVVPLVYWMLIGSKGSSSGHSTSSGAPSKQALADEEHVLELRQVGADLVDHRPVVRGLERRRRDQRLAARLPQRVGQLGGAVGRVDVDEDHPELRGRELGRRPTRRSWAPRSPPGRPCSGRGRRARARRDRRARRARGRSSGRSWWRTTSASRSGYVATARSKFSPIVSPSSGVVPSPCEYDSAIRSLLSGLRSTSVAAASQPGAAATRDRRARRWRSRSAATDSGELSEPSNAPCSISSRYHSTVAVTVCASGRGR